MSGRRLIFVFKDCWNLAFNEEMAPQGGTIDFNMEFDEVSMDYYGPLMDVVLPQEKEGLRSLLRFSTRNKHSLKGKEVMIQPDPMEGTGRLPSMIATPAERLVVANEERVPFAPSQKTIRRNASRCRHVHVNVAKLVSLFLSIGLL